MKPPTEPTKHEPDPPPSDRSGGDDARVPSRFAAGSSNYTEEREALFRDLSLEDILTEIRGASSAESA